MADDWMRRALEGLAEPDKEDGKAGSLSSINEAFDIGKETAKKIREMTIQASRPLATQGKPMEATIVLFVAVWMNFVWAKSGLNKLDPKSPVTRLWQLFEVGMSKDSPEEAHIALTKWAKDNGLI